MEILKKADIVTERSGNFGRDPSTPGMYEEWLLDHEKLETLLNMKDDDVALVSTEELGSRGNTANGCAYGINKVCVAAGFPLKAKAKGKTNVTIVHTGDFNEDNYATDNTIKTRNSDTAYEQPSPAQINRVRKWLEDNGYIAGSDVESGPEDNIEGDDE